MKQTLNKFDQRLTGLVAATFGQSARPFFAAMTMLGDPLAISLITIVLIATGVATSNTPLALSGAVIPITVLIGALLKMMFERARPITEYALNMKLKTFSFPSGHSSGSMITFGVLAVLALQFFSASFAVIICIVLLTVPVFVGLSRVYLGAHFPSDVIAGWLLGILALLFVILVLRPIV